MCSFVFVTVDSLQTNTTVLEANPDIWKERMREVKYISMYDVSL